MKTLFRSSKWKTDPRAAYIPGAALASFVILFCLVAGPAWSFETVEGDSVFSSQTQNSFTTTQPKPTSSPTVADPCLPLLKSIRHTPPTSAMDRNQRSAGSAAALGLVLGVRFALSPPTKTNPNARKPRVDLWQPVASAGDRSALTVSAYRNCQKDQALKALKEFRWTR